MYIIYNVFDIISKNLLWFVVKFLKFIGFFVVGCVLFIFECVWNCKSEKCFYLCEILVNYDKFIICFLVVLLI